MIHIPCRTKGCTDESMTRNTEDADGVVRGWCAKHAPEVLPYSADFPEPPPYEPPVDEPDPEPVDEGPEIPVLAYPPPEVVPPEVAEDQLTTVNRARRLSSSATAEPTE
jgi:hypothetical protein